ncbi:uncharacterized protein LOC126794697 isoform X2 [Argentina anserina]|uniref:uncharacterized protein LOC126794697 isoform X2 n=1 Tax=Argentina anserina TaxID=57926 RepID=UPI00217657E4|nr:uncharacterized protein LOC126794697 isoform X2 [Potentilla anserina]
MLGTRLQFGNVRGEDRFYIAGKGRRRNNQQQKQARKAKNDANQSPKESKVAVFENKETHGALTKPCSDPTLTPRSNLDRFLESTTPSVPAQYFSETMRGMRTCDVEFQPFFALNDLWESFREWSAYGAGVPLVLNKCDSVMQYYVPYLSGIQLYGETEVKSSAKQRQVGEDNDVDYYLDSSSDASSDYEIEKHMKITREQKHFLHQLNSEVSSRLGRLSVCDDEHLVSQEGFSSDDGEAVNSPGLLFEYLERDAPYGREPLADKISDLARKYPRLKSLRSCDLLQGSWMSVAWYPIYRIPTGPTLKDLDACFLTYHSLSTSMTGGSGSVQAPVMVYPSEMDDVPKISLRTFGLASYKLKGSLWAQNGTECQLADSLMQDAVNWLSLLQVNHPDFQFFASHGMYCR